MPTPPAYAKLLNSLAVLKQQNPDPNFEGCEEILAHIAIRESEAKPTKVTDLVQSLQFGTGPTVHRKVEILVTRQLIKVAPDPSDARAKLLMLAAKGVDLLKEKSKLMKLCLNV